MDWSSFFAGALSMCAVSVAFILFCMRFAKLHPPERAPAETDGTELANTTIINPHGLRIVR